MDTSADKKYYYGYDYYKPYQSKYYEAHKTDRIAYVMDWRDKNKDKVSDYNKQYKARKKAFHQEFQRLATISL